MIVFDQVSFQYPHQKQVIHNLSFCIQAGEYVSIIGANGSGKSTVVKLMNGLIKPSEGNVKYKQLNTKELNDINYIRQKVGMIFQNPEHQTIATTVLDDVAFGLQNLALPSKEIIETARGALEQVDMLEYEEADINHLSGGQLQKVAIAGILAMDPEVIIFDESTAMLDPMGKENIFNIIKFLNDSGITIIFVTHDMDSVLEGSRVIVLEKGSILYDGKPKAVFENMNWSASKMTAPFVIEVREQLYKLGVSIPRSIMNIEELADFVQWKLQ